MIHLTGGGCGLVFVRNDGLVEYIASAVVRVMADSRQEAEAAAESIADGNVACGWAFDAGMREAEVDAARSLWLGGREAVAAAVAAERERCERERCRNIDPDCMCAGCMAVMDRETHWTHGAPAPREG